MIQAAKQRKPLAGSGLERRKKIIMFSLTSLGCVCASVVCDKEGGWRTERLGSNQLLAVWRRERGWERMKKRESHADQQPKRQKKKKKGRKVGGIVWPFPSGPSLHISKLLLLTINTWKGYRGHSKSFFHQLHSSTPFFSLFYPAFISHTRKNGKGKGVAKKYNMAI